jgi:hypothetical protein
MQWLVPVLSALLTGSGLWALLAARQTARATVAAAQATAAPATITAATADWSSLMTFWQNEIAVLRSEIGKLEVRVAILDRQREEDAQYIGELEQHILNELPPPPPMRRRFIVKVEEGQ